MASQAQSRARDEADLRRDQIIDEAIRIVGERGYFGFTVQDLAQRCGVSNAGLLYHFRTKDQLLLCMLQEFERRETEALTPLAELAQQEMGRSQAAATLLDLLRTMVARAITHPEIGRLYLVLQSETLDPKHPAHDSFRRRETLTLGLFAKLIAPYVDDAHAAARQLLALMDGLSLQWVRSDQDFDMLAEWDRAVATVLPKLTRAPRSPKKR
jgi:AcrR family transcriptional regulator